MEAFSATRNNTARVNLLNTPIALVQRRALPPDFILKALLERLPGWSEALNSTPEVLTIYDRDDLYQLEAAKQAFAGQIRAKLEAILMAANPIAIIAEQEKPSQLAKSWSIIKGQANLALKIRQKASRHAKLSPKILPNGQAPLAEWVMRDENYAVTIARTWEPGTQTLTAWLEANQGQEKAALKFFANALRDAADLHAKGLLFVDWDLRNIAVRETTGHLSDYEGAVITGSQPYLLSKTMAALLDEDPDRYEKGLTVKDDMEIAAHCLDELIEISATKTRATNNLLLDMSQGRISAIEVAALLDNLAV